MCECGIESSGRGRVCMCVCVDLLEMRARECAWFLIYLYLLWVCMC